MKMRVWLESLDAEIARMWLCRRWNWQPLAGSRRVSFSCLMDASSMLWMRAPFRKATGSLLNYKLCTRGDHFLSLAYQWSAHYHRNCRALDNVALTWIVIARNLFLSQLRAHRKEEKTSGLVCSENTSWSFLFFALICSNLQISPTILKMNWLTRFSLVTGDLIVLGISLVDFPVV